MSPAPVFSIVPGDPSPIYRQIVEQVKAAIAAGALAAGDRLPTHRQLALDLVVAPLTVKKAYDLLQDEGLVEMVQGRGTFVSGLAASARSRAREELASRARALVLQARAMDVSRRDVRRLVDREWKEAASRVRSRR